MPPSGTSTPADVGDRHRHLLAFALLAIGGIHSVSADGFVAETVRRAQKASWEATFVLVVVLATLDETIAGLGLPPEFYLSGIVALMAGVFALVFLVLNRIEAGGGAGEIEDPSRA